MNHRRYQQSRNELRDLWLGFAFFSLIGPLCLVGMLYCYVYGDAIEAFCAAHRALVGFSCLAIGLLGCYFKGKRKW